MFQEPSYLKLLRSGDFEKRLIIAIDHLKVCDCCPNRCGVNRIQGELGTCKTGYLSEVSSYGPHHGEENPLRGWRGSGTIFFTHCHLQCVYCQNYDVSQLTYGNIIDEQSLAQIMLYLQKIGCHNINLVSPSHVIPQIIYALFVAANEGLSLPIVYNTGGYDSIEMLQLLDGIIDIYMPDMKYADEKIAFQYSKIHNYPSVNQIAIREMHRQVNDLVVDENGVAYRGLLVRHLILPNYLSGTREVIKFLAEEISCNTYLNLMDQYRPEYKASSFPEIDRPASYHEIQNAREIALNAGLHRLD